MPSDRPPSLTLRRATPADVPFLMDVHREAMRPHVERVWGAWEEEKARRRWAETDPATHDIIMWKGVPAGLRRIRRHADALELVRLALLPEYQNRGIGSHLMQELVDEAQAHGLPIRLRVFKGNPAKRLYERLGFRVTRETEAHHEMLRPHDP